MPDSVLQKGDLIINKIARVCVLLELAISQDLGDDFNDYGYVSIL